MKQDIPTPNRQQVLIDLYVQYLLGTLTQGELLSYLRKIVLKLSQEKYATLVGVSRRTITDIEQNKGSQTTQILDKVFKPLGLKTGLVPTHTHIAKKILQQTED